MNTETHCPCCRTPVIRHTKQWRDSKLEGLQIACPNEYWNHYKTKNGRHVLVDEELTEPPYINAKKIKLPKEVKRWTGDATS